MSVDLDAHLDDIKLGDAGAFARWLALAERPVRESLRKVAAHVDSEAVVQETFLRVWQVAPRIERDGKSNSLLRFAMRVAHNLAVSELRLRTASVETSVLEEVSDVEVVPPDPLLRRVIATCKDALPEQPARALMARIESGGADADEVLAERLGMKKNTFLQNFTRARKLLAECLERKGVSL